jgi:NADH dehydrogenase [ubiquinone] 1 alpha subcomplex assembly factor 3
MDIYSTAATPATAIDACTPHGFHLNNGVKISGGSGVLLFGGEAFAWRPWSASASASATASASIGSLLTPTGTLEIPLSSLGVLDLLYPKPDLLIVGTGSRLWGLGREAREFLTRMGVRVDVMDTGNASAAYNLLATERGLDGVGAALLPVGWRGPGRGR